MIPQFARSLLDYIGSKEAPQGYEQVSDYVPPSERLQGLTGRTLNEVIDWQRRVGPQYGSSAAGRYQFMPDTLEDLKRTMGLSGQERMTPELQDQMAFSLLQRRGYDNWAGGAMTDTAFGDSLAREWAIMPVHSDQQGHKRPVARGETYYAGDGLNRTNISPDEVMGVLRDATAAPAPPRREATMQPPVMAGIPGPDNETAMTWFDQYFLPYIGVAPGGTPKDAIRTAETLMDEPTAPKTDSAAMTEQPTPARRQGRPGAGSGYVSPPPSVPTRPGTVPSPIPSGAAPPAPRPGAAIPEDLLTDPASRTPPTPFEFGPPPLPDALYAPGSDPGAPTAMQGPMMPWEFDEPPLPDALYGPGPAGALDVTNIQSTSGEMPADATAAAPNDQSLYDMAVEWLNTGDNREKLISLGTGLLTTKSWGEGLGRFGELELARRGQAADRESLMQRAQLAGDRTGQDWVPIGNVEDSVTGKVISGVSYNRRTGEYRDFYGNPLENPPRDINNSQLGQEKRVNDLRTQITETSQTLTQLDRVMDRYESMNGAGTGWEGVGNYLGRLVRAMRGQGLTDEQIQQGLVGAEGASLIGKFRLSVGGPGAMTEADALRVIQSFGSSRFQSEFWNTLFTSPELVGESLNTWYDDYTRMHENALTQYNGIVDGNTYYSTRGWTPMEPYQAGDWKKNRGRRDQQLGRGALDTTNEDAPADAGAAIPLRDATELKVGQVYELDGQKARYVGPGPDDWEMIE